ncbi:MAG: DUF1571 domain-containing protein [Isosphaeraceae bacterium]|nr:DUF1571 domain-containing protein [Isosphaeraceae bacterium]
MLVESGGRGSKESRARRPWVWALSGLGIVAAAIAAISIWLTEPLEPEDVAALRTLDQARAPHAPEPERELRSTALEWPVGTLDGPPAKRLLLEVLLDAESRIDRVTGYTATFRKQERISGVLRDEETLAIKVRHRPFAFYGKFLAPRAGKEVVFAEGHHGNKVIATGGGLTRLLVPRLALDPTGPLALADSRHPVTEAGLANLIHRLARFRKLDLEDEAAATVLDRWTDERGKVWLRSVHTHPRKNPERPFARVEVLYDPATLYPMRISNFDWQDPPADGQVVGALAERYTYADLEVDVPLTALDFDPANPNYAFQRF